MCGLRDLYKIGQIVGFSVHLLILGDKDDWDFRISDPVKNPDGTDI